MLLIIGPFPTTENEREGMVQRIKAVDKLVFECHRNYIQPGRRKPFIPFSKEINRAEIVYLSTLWPWHKSKWRAMFQDASLIYVHSVFMVEAIAQFYPEFGYKIITDMHGVVPEEFDFSGDLSSSKKYELYESVAIRYSAHIICVSRAMKIHFLSKYKDLLPSRLILLRILEQKSPVKIHGDIQNAADLHLLYAGGMQPWQEIDKMLSVISQLRNKPYQFTLLVPEVPKMLEKVEYFGLQDRVRIDSVKPEKMTNEYAKADIGIVFREDNILNRVSFPTKLFEYLENTLVPLVLCSDIGDFLEYGYRYISIDEMLGKTINKSDLSEIREQNVKVYEKIVSDSVDEVSHISKILYKASGNLKND